MSSNELEIEERNDLCRAVAAAQALNHINAWICEHRHQVLFTLLRAACNPVSTRKCPLSQLDAISLRLPPRDSPQHIRIDVVWAGRGDYTDCPSWRKSVRN